MLLCEQRNHAQKLYLYEPGSFRPLAFVERNQVYFYHLDHLGTPQEMTDWEGRVVWSARYRVYGNVLKQDVETVENNLRFQGQYFDAETGLHYNRFRYYDPGTGQFTQQDPVGLLGGVNNYQYAPNPTGWVDPLGLVCKELGISTAQMDELRNLVSTDPERAYFKLDKMIKDGQLDFSTQRDGAVFWSGGKMETAQQWAAANGKTTLEQTKGGRVLAELKLFENPSFDNAKAAKLWNKASNKFASQASGDLNAFSTGATRYGDYGERTWWRIEKPILQKNDAVNSVTRLKIDGTPSKTGHLLKD
ncbi:MAG: RHS repeat-associated core domain-containing protein [Gammaproteobacteria bacterium]